MGELDTQLEQIDISIEQAKETIAMKKALDNLTDNPDFIKIIIDGYLKDEALRLVMLRADDRFKEDLDQAGLMKAIDAIGNFKMYCNTIMQMGRMAENAVLADQKTREEILDEVG